MNKKIKNIFKSSLMGLTLLLCSCHINVLDHNNIKKVRAENTYYETVYTGDLTEGIDTFLVCNSDDNEYTNANWSYSISRTLNDNTNLYDYYINFTHITNSGSVGDFFKYIYFNFETSNFAYDSEQPNYFLLALKTDSSLYNVDFEYTNFKNMIGDSYDFVNRSIDSDFTVCTYDNDASVQFDHNYKGRLTYSNTLRPTGTGVGAMSTFYMFSLKVSYIYSLNSNNNYYANSTPSTQESYDLGYNNGYGDGFEIGSVKGESLGKELTIRDDYQNKTYQQIYTEGVLQGERNTQSFGSLLPTLFGSLVNIPISVLNGLAPLTFFDLSIIKVVITLLMLNVILWIIRKVLI